MKHLKKTVGKIEGLRSYNYLGKQGSYSPCFLNEHFHWTPLNISRPSLFSHLLDQKETSLYSPFPSFPAALHLVNYSEAKSSVSLWWGFHSLFCLGYINNIETTLAITSFSLQSSESIFITRDRVFFQRKMEQFPENMEKSILGKKRTIFGTITYLQNQFSWHVTLII